jgi:hypothetical protein
MKLLKSIKSHEAFVMKTNKNKEMTNISIKKYLEEIVAPQHLAFPLKNK